LPCLSISIILGVWPMSRRKEKKWCREKFEGRVWPKTNALEAAGAEMIGHQDIYVSMRSRPLLGLLNASGGLLTYNSPYTGQSLEGVLASQLCRKPDPASGEKTSPKT